MMTAAMFCKLSRVNARSNRRSAIVPAKEMPMFGYLDTGSEIFDHRRNSKHQREEAGSLRGGQSITRSAEPGKDWTEAGKTGKTEKGQTRTVKKRFRLVCSPSIFLVPSFFRRSL